MPRPFFKLQKSKIDEIVRVDHAGEFGAQRIYEGQIKNTKDEKEKAQIKHMLSQELEHLEYFENKISTMGARPTILFPFWHFVGYAIGAISARISPRTAMLVTERVEEVIEEHYQEQIDFLEQVDPENGMIKDLKKFRQDEIDHKHIAIEHNSREAPLAPFFATGVHYMCKVAIYLSKKI